MEEVRRLLVGKYGEDLEDGPHGVYSGGLWVRTSYAPRMQEAAERAFRDGLMRFAGGKGWRDPGLSIDVSDDWRGQPAPPPFRAGYGAWRPGGALPKEGDSRTHGFPRG